MYGKNLSSQDLDYESQLHYLWNEPLVCPVKFLFDTSHF